MKFLKISIIFVLGVGVGIMALAIQEFTPEKSYQVEAFTPLPSEAENTNVDSMTEESSRSSQNESVWTGGAALLDNQGAVTVEITPVNLDDFGETLIFEVAMNTHSVDLSMDLAKLSKLVTDNGVNLDGFHWDGPSGGHHVTGLLSFSVTEEVAALINQANQITLYIRDVDAPERIFTWQK